MKIEFNRPMLDWVTLTSYDGKLTRKGTRILDSAGMSSPFARKIICYDGWASDGREGGAFVGVGEQDGRFHCMLQLSGALADKFGPGLLAGHKTGEGIGNVSRIDLQITIAEKIDLDALAAALVGTTRSQITIYRTLQGGQPGDTLYIGSPKSDKRTRLYHKAGGTRFEAQYRRDYASDVAARIKDTGSQTVQQVVAGLLYDEVLCTGRGLSCDNTALWPFENILDDWCHGVRLRPESNGRAVGDTEQWLRKTVMGAMVRECQINEQLRLEILARLQFCDPQTGEIKR
jgi:hypothetical protein